MADQSGGVWDLPFEASEYAARLAGVRAEMARRGIDVLYVTSPSNLNYLLGHRAVWFDPRNVTGLAVPAADVPPVYFDTYDHAPGWPPTIADAVKYGEHGFYYPEGAQVVADTLKARGLLRGRLGLEYWSWAPGGPAFAELARRLSAAGPPDVVDGSWVVDHVRLVKSPRELAYTREALAIADAAYQALADALTPGMTEHEIDALLAYECKRRGGDEPGIRTMVRTGPQTAAFHAPAGDRRIQDGDLLMIDMSAVRHQYHGNTARAFSIGGHDFWADALAKLVAARDETCAQIRPGDPTQKLQDLMDVAVDAAGLRPYVWWVGGYVLGASVPPDWVGHVYLSDEEGFEPGVFAPGFVANWEVQLWDLPDGGGVGVIDTMIATPDGIEVPARFPGTLTVV
jgi:Xaa-Pro aminopeptidase